MAPQDSGHDLHSAQRRARLRAPARHRPSAAVIVEEFRSGLRKWLDENDLTPGPDHSLRGHMLQYRRVSRALYDADWMRYGWPVEVGGLGGPAVLRAIVGEEVVGRRLAEPGPYSMLEVLTPTMIDYAPPNSPPKWCRDCCAGKSNGAKVFPSRVRAAIWRR